MAVPKIWNRFFREATFIQYKIRSDSDLLLLAQAGNTRAFDEFVLRYSSRTYTLAHELLGHDEQAAESVSAAFVTAYRNLDDFNEARSAGAWFYRHALRTIFDRHRTNGRMEKSTTKEGSHEGLREEASQS